MYSPMKKLTPEERQALRNLTHEEKNAKRKEEMQAFRNLTPEERKIKHREERQSRRNERIAMRNERIAMINATPEERNAKREERKIKHDELFADIFVRYADSCKADNTALASRVGELEVGMGEVKTEMKTFLDIAKDTNTNTRWLALEILLAAILVPVFQHFLGK